MTVTPASGVNIVSAEAHRSSPALPGVARQSEGPGRQAGCSPGLDGIVSVVDLEEGPSARFPGPQGRAFHQNLFVSDTRLPNVYPSCNVDTEGRPSGRSPVLGTGAPARALPCEVSRLSALKTLLTSGTP